jgi:N-acyl-D-amino-acid deacylase
LKRRPKSAREETTDMPDMVIMNGIVYDGTGAPGFRADVAITGDRIEAIAPEMYFDGCAKIDVAGKIVCPGIVDPHSHADMSFIRDDHKKILEPLVRQGITTFVGGNCGISLAPLGGNNKQQLKDYIETFTGADFDMSVSWKGTGSFMEHAEKSGMILNAALLAPHGLLRIDAMGLDARNATGDEVKKMEARLEECMEAGAVGLSTGLQYPPGSQSDTGELVALGKALAKYDGIFTSHLRSYMNTHPQAVDEVVEVGRTNNIRTQISHIFWVPDMGRLGRPFRKVMRGLI